MSAIPTSLSLVAKLFNSSKADSARLSRVKPDAVLVSTALKLSALAFKVLARD